MAAPAGAHGGRYGSTMALLLIANAVDAADLSLLPGLFRALEQDFGVGPKGLASLVLSQSTLKGLAYPAWGVLSDRYPRKPALWGACVAWGLAAAALVFCTSFELLAACLGAGGVALACLMPVSQSMMSDIIPAHKRGTAFGQMQLAGNVGSLLGGALSTVTSELMVFGIWRGWRLCFMIVAVISLALAPAICVFLKEPARGGVIDDCIADVATDDHADGVSFSGENGPLTEPMPTHRRRRRHHLGLCDQVRLIFSRRTFLLLVGQGVVGNMPWVAFDSFGVLWLQYLGFENSVVAQLMIARRLGGAGGALFGGWLSDKLFGLYGDGARIACAQFSVLSGMPMIYVTLMLLPRTPNEYWLYCASLLLFGFGASWCTPACNRPIITEIVQPEIRGSIIGFWIGIETVISALSAPAAAYLAKDVFGYERNPQPVDEMDDETRRGNVDALARALLWTMIVPWVPCFLFYTAMHWTYKKDKAEYHAQLSTLMAGRGQVERESSRGSRDLNPAMTVRGRGSATSSAVHDGEQETTSLLARGRSNTDAP
jgi:MFS family permease